MPLPCRRIRNGFSFPSLLAIFTVALRSPLVAGQNVTKNAVVALGARTLWPGAKSPTVKSPVLGPDLLRARPVRLAPPLFRIVNDTVTLLPTDVSGNN